MKKLLLLLFLPLAVSATESKARNVILFLGDAGGVSTLNAASLYAYNRPQALYIQSMAHFALSDTSALNHWVTDSAAGMTAIVTGHKTNNGMLSLLPGGESGAGVPIKTILEYAEERGLSTGVVTNMSVWDATPGACYSHVASRRSTGEIFSHFLKPRFGDGVDILVGADRKGVLAAMEKLGVNADQAMREAGYEVFDHPEKLSAGVSRATAIYDGGDFSPEPVVEAIIQSLAKNPKGFFLMVEWDMHTNRYPLGLDRVIVMDNLIRKVSAQLPPDTLVLFAADHSFDLRLRGGNRDHPLKEQIDAQTPEKPVLRVDNSHTGEEILVAAQGPGAERVRGFIPNTEIFKIMMSAYGWDEKP